jgi:hypothetical protein
MTLLATPAIIYPTESPVTTSRRECPAAVSSLLSMERRLHVKRSKILRQNKNMILRPD